MTCFVRSLALAASLLLPGLSLASVGQVSVLEGRAFRTPEKGMPIPLKVGSEIEVKDRIQVAVGGNLKLTLTDASVLMLGSGSELIINEAQFKGLERKGFAATLSIGKIWAKVTHALAGSDARFKVSTERAVAGVRGTIFRMDAVKVLDAARPPKVRSFTVVRVANGRVAVDASKVSTRAKKEAPPQLLAMVGLPAAGGKPERHQVKGPTQVTQEEWEKRFTELQARQMVAVGEDLWQEAGGWVPESDDDAFARFVKKQDGLTEAAPPKRAP